MRGRPPSGYIFEIALNAGLELPRTHGKVPICCPFHDDATPSAFLSEHNVFYCSVCTPGRGWSASRFKAELGRAAQSRRDATSREPRTPERRVTPLAEVEELWLRARVRARDEDAVELDRSSYEYLVGRQLMPAWEIGLAGVLGPGMALPYWGMNWIENGYRLVCPLFGRDGELANIQARAISAKRPKVMTATGLTTKGVAFANVAGRELLKGIVGAPAPIFVCEGLTDFLAVASEVSSPVLGVAGAGVAAAVLDRWVRGREVVLALDHDDAGDGALEPVLDALTKFGASGAQRVRWPLEARDACEALDRLGVSEFAGFLKSIVSEVAPCT